MFKVQSYRFKVSFSIVPGSMFNGSMVQGSMVQGSRVQLFNGSRFN